MGVVGAPTPQVLKNRGVPVTMHVVAVNEAGRWTRTFDEMDEPVTEVRWVQMTNDVLASIEDAATGWGSMDAWQAALTTSPNDALCRTLAICLDWWKVTPGQPEVPDRVRAGRAMLDGQKDAYSAAIGGAFMLANGLDPVAVGKQLAAGVRQGQAAKTQMLAMVEIEMDRANAEADVALAAASAAHGIPTPPPSGTPSPGGPVSGSAPDGDSTSSGG